MEGAGAGGRKRGRKSTACWVCKEAHRACEGSRPCRRCVIKHTENECMGEPSPQGINRRRRDPSRNQMVSRKRKRVEINCGITSAPKDDIIVELVRTVGQLTNMTRSLHADQQQLQTRIEELQGNPSRSSIDLRLNEREGCKALCLGSSKDLNIELHGMQTHAHTTCAIASVAQDHLRFNDSVFLPFALEDTSKPFMVFRTWVVDHDALQRADLETLARCDLKSVMHWTLLAANEPFYALTQYSEEELQALGVEKLTPEGTRTGDGEEALVPYLVRQPESVRVSPAVVVTPYCQSKDGTIFRVATRMQYFYSEDGFISFGVAAFVDAWIAHPNTHAATTPTTPLGCCPLEEYFPELLGGGGGCGKEEEEGLPLLPLYL